MHLRIGLFLYVMFRIVDGSLDGSYHIQYLLPEGVYLLLYAASQLVQGRPSGKLRLGLDYIHYRLSLGQVYPAI